MENIAKALIKAQTELTNPEKNQQGYGYKYADLSSILDQVKPVLQKHGLVVVQPAIDDGNGRVGVKTILLHESGESIKSTLTLPIPEMKGTTATQNAGAALTYARRYALCSILGINADEDTDAGIKKAPVKTEASSQKPKYQNNASISEKQVKLVNTLITNTGTDRDKVKETYKVESLNDLSMYEAIDLIDKLKAKQENINKSK